MFTPKIGEDEPILTHIFQMGWDHQPVPFWMCTYYFSFGLSTPVAVATFVTEMKKDMIGYDRTLVFTLPKFNIAPEKLPSQ